MKIKKILPFIIIAVIIAALIVVRNIASKMSIIPDNPETQIGNTAGNLYNGGLFCEAEDGIYFSNAYDGGALYFMAADGTMKKIAEGNIRYINAAGEYLYYYTAETSSGAGLGYVRGGRGIYRISRKGKNDAILTHGTSDSVMLLGNYVYYSCFGDTDAKDNAVVTTKRISINGGKEEDVSAEHILLGSTDGFSIYYSGVSGDHHLYAMDPATRISRSIINQDVYLPIVQGGYIYYLDIHDGYKLKRRSTSGGEAEIIVNERVDSYNLYGDMIFYQNCNPDAYALMRVRTDGSDLTKIFDGVTEGISCTGEYTYFTSFGSDVPVYKVSTRGSSTVTNFSEALNAAVENMK